MTIREAIERHIVNLRKNMEFQDDDICTILTCLENSVFVQVVEGIKDQLFHEQIARQAERFASPGTMTKERATEILLEAERKFNGT